MRSFGSDACGPDSVTVLPTIGDGNHHRPAAISSAPAVDASQAEQNDGPIGVQERPPSFLTIREAAGVLRVSESTIRNAVGSGQLRAFRFGARGGSIRITRADLDAYIAGAATAPLTTHTAAPSGGQLKHLNASRLLAAWRQQGVLGKQQNKRPSS
jgi:excisionase family DNA binding protein